jgi:acetyl esterase/lipase
VAVGGDSAGATIAACAALAVRDRGDSLAAQVLAYPPLDPLCRASSYHRDRDAFPKAAVLAAAWTAPGQSRTLADLHPGRVDLGSGRAGGPADTFPDKLHHLVALAAEHRVAEIMVNTLAPDLADRIRTYELLAEAFGATRPRFSPVASEEVRSGQ